MRPRDHDHATRRHPLRGLGIVLAWCAIALHFAQVGHFLGVAHEVGADGALHHSSGALRDANGACAAGDAHDPHTLTDRDASPTHPADPIPGRDHDDDRCPLLPPGLESCDAAEPFDCRPVPLGIPAAQPWPAAPTAPDDVLAYAPKQSPPESCPS